jgi:hypothetical protein
MGRPGAFLQALKKTTPHARAAFVFNQAWQKTVQARVKPRQRVGRVIFQDANINPCLNDRPVGPDVGPPQVHHPKDVYIFRLCHGVIVRVLSTVRVQTALCILAQAANTNGRPRIAG